MLTLPGTKTRRAHRALPLADHPPLRALLEAVLSGAPGTSGTRGTPGSPGTPLFPRWSNIRRDLEAACTAAGVPRVSPNDLRRTFGTWCRMAGMPTDRIAVLLGHADARMVERVYGRLDPATMGAEIRATFSGLALPALPVLLPTLPALVPAVPALVPALPALVPALPERLPGSAGIGSGSNRVTDDEQSRGRMGQMTPAPPEESSELPVPRAGIEPATRGFSVRHHLQLVGWDH
jgi:hypothetical protein